MAKDPAIGRIGYVIEGFGDGTAENPREIRCNGCRGWFDGREGACTFCGRPRPGFNKRLRAAQLDNHLLGYAHGASQEASLAPVTSNVKLPH